MCNWTEIKYRKNTELNYDMKTDIRTEEENMEREESAVESVDQLHVLPLVALFSQVTLLVAVLILVPIIIVSIIVLIAVWRKVRRASADV